MCECNNSNLNISTVSKVVANDSLFFMGYDHKEVREISKIRLKRHKLIAIARTKNIIKKAKIHIIYGFKALRLEIKRISKGDLLWDF